MDDENGGVFVNFAKVFLMLINMILLIAGCLLVYFSSRVQNSGWMEAFDGEYAWVGRSSFIFILILGAIVIIMSILGCAGAWLRNRLLLTVYAGILVLALVFFAVITYGASSAKSKATNWNAKEFPADKAETSIGENFNELYCYALVPYYCNSARVVDVLDMFNVKVAGGYFTDQGMTNISALCDVLQLDEVDAVCKVCAQAEKYASYTPVLEWAQTQCPKTPGNQLWCGNFLMTGKAGEVFANQSPYSECRPAVFSLVTKWSNVAFMGCLVLCFVVVAVLLFACAIRRSANRRDRDSAFQAHRMYSLS